MEIVLIVAVIVMVILVVIAFVMEVIKKLRVLVMEHIMFVDVSLEIVADHNVVVILFVQEIGGVINQ
jgi:hypothetical protein